MLAVKLCSFCMHDLSVADMLLRKFLPPLTIKERSGTLHVTLLIPSFFFSFCFAGGAHSASALGCPFSLINVRSVFHCLLTFFILLSLSNLFSAE